MKETSFINFMRKLACYMVLSLVATAISEEPKTEEKKPEPPTALLAIPFILARDHTTQCVIRGHRLDSAVKVTVPAGVIVAITSKGEAKLPNGWKPEQLGDRQVTCDITLDPSFPLKAKTVQLTFSNDASETATITISVADANTLIDEKEPNSGFKKSQLISFGQTIRGSIAADKDVDVFRLDAKAGDELNATVIARQHNSALDPILALYDSKGFECARNDDSAETGRDSALSLKISADGPYYLAVQDAHDAGSEAHVYQLQVDRR
ncbi:MAG: hypothetical protein ACI9R3_002370 [Verrucomicrobiales bacterium]|jgi:hypothetical protein